ncbi:hypothetical protein JYU34_007202 [Plutella xylostella]|uniref:Uncharacterized protein n=1 Tax=Plutella xylostella TaxID=51655 RepID=A0ABQ7QPS8_PLUXY|nr:hypothetical protein JYU34_007202 [Plutella xylostella]
MQTDELLTAGQGISECHEESGGVSARRRRRRRRRDVEQHLLVRGNKKLLSREYIEGGGVRHRAVAVLGASGPRPSCSHQEAGSSVHCAARGQLAPPPRARPAVDAARQLCVCSSFIDSRRGARGTRGGVC